MGKPASNAKYRDPGYMGGLCAMCRKKMRDMMHPKYPSMCADCRQTRIKPFEDMMPDTSNMDVSTARSAGMDVVIERNFSPKELAEAGRLAREKLKQLGIDYKPRVQNLNGELDPRLKALFNKQEK